MVNAIGEIKATFEIGGITYNEQIIIKKLNTPQSIIFCIKEKEVLKFVENGDIYIKGNLVDNDKEVVSMLKEFLSSAKIKY